MIDIVVIGQAYAGNLARKFTPGPAEEIPLPKVIDAGRFEGFALNAVAGIGLVKLVSREEKHIGIGSLQALRNLLMRETKIPLAGEWRRDDLLLVPRILADGAGVAIVEVADFERMVARVIQLGHGKCGCGRKCVHIDGGSLFAIDAEFRSDIFLNRHKLGGEPKVPPVQRILGEQDGSPGALGVGGHLGAAQLPIRKPESHATAASLVGLASVRLDGLRHGRNPSGQIAMVTNQRHPANQPFGRHFPLHRKATDTQLQAVASGFQAQRDIFPAIQLRAIPRLLDEQLTGMG